MKNYQLLLPKLFEDWAGESAVKMDQLAQAGSDRRYFRIFGETKQAIGTYNADFKENKAFMRFTQHFWKKGLRVPEIYGENLLNGVYLQQDLSNCPGAMKSSPDMTFPGQLPVRETLIPGII